MRVFTIAAILAMACGAAQAQPATSDAGPPLGPPSAFAGYTQPDITPGLCKKVSESQVQCIIPAMTAGRYYVEASGTSTATAAGAAQRLIIQVGDDVNPQCGSGTLAQSAEKPWNVGTARTFKFGCVVTVVTDRALPIIVVYQDEKAAKDPKGPSILVRRIFWGGVLYAVPQVPNQSPPAPPTPTPAPSPAPRSRKPAQ